MRATEALIGYKEFFLRSRHLKEEEVQCFLVSAHKPLRKTRELLGFTELLHPGVYGSPNVFLARKQLIVLSELSDAPSNTFFKLFAHNHQAKQAALTTFEQQHRAKLEPEIEWLILGLLNLWKIGETIMRAITKEDLIKRGRELPRQVLSLMTDEELAELLRNKPFVQQLRQQSLEEGREEGREEGLEQGLERGREEGREEGLVQGLHSALKLGLELKFGAAGLELLPEITQIKQLAVLEVLHEALKTAPTPAAIRQLYQPQE